MCFSVESATLAKLKYAMHRGDIHYAEELQRQLDEMQIFSDPKYYVSAFSHPKLLVFTNDQPMKPREFSWGLIPFWVKEPDVAKMHMKKTLNAKCETMFSLSSFRDAAKKNRCLVYVDGFYEYHSYNKKKYPFRITMANGDPMVMGGLWSDWVDKSTGEVINTVSIVTTSANDIMAKIHNEPASSDTPRMPVILTKDNQDEWLMEVKNDVDKNRLMELCRPLDPSLLAFHTVPKLSGKESPGNVPRIAEKFEYPDLIFS